MFPGNDCDLFRSSQHLRKWHKWARNPCRCFPNDVLWTFQLNAILEWDYEWFGFILTLLQISPFGYSTVCHVQKHYWEGNAVHECFIVCLVMEGFRMYELFVYLVPCQFQKGLYLFSRSGWYYDIKITKCCYVMQRVRTGARAPLGSIVDYYRLNCLKWNEVLQRQTPASRLCEKQNRGIWTIEKATSTLLQFRYCTISLKSITTQNIMHLPTCNRLIWWKYVIYLQNVLNNTV